MVNKVTILATNKITEITGNILGGAEGVFKADFKDSLNKGREEGKELGKNVANKCFEGAGFALGTAEGAVEALVEWTNNKEVLESFKNGKEFSKQFCPKIFAPVAKVAGAGFGLIEGEFEAIKEGFKEGEKIGYEYGESIGTCFKNTGDEPNNSIDSILNKVTLEIQNTRKKLRYREKHSPYSPITKVYIKLQKYKSNVEGYWDFNSNPQQPDINDVSFDEPSEAGQSSHSRIISNSIISERAESEEVKQIGSRTSSIHINYQRNVNQIPGQNRNIQNSKKQKNKVKVNLSLNNEIEVRLDI